jgi:fatty-acyl-CoA synthase
LRDRAGLHPERIAVKSAGGEIALSYADLNGLANRAAQALVEAGVGPGERVAIALGNDPLVLALYFAAAKLGAIFLPLNTRLAAPELSFQIADAEPRLVICGADVELEGAGQVVREAAFRAALPKRAPEPELAPGGEVPQVIMYTSGTTGVAKGAVLPHRKTVCNSLNAEQYFGLREGDVVVVPVPLFHSYGLKILSVPALFCGATLVLVERFDPTEIQQTIAREGASLLGVVPVMVQRMIRAGLNRDALGCLRMAFTAGAPIDVASVQAFHAAGVPLVQGFGQTETSILCCLDVEHALSRAGSVGRPVEHCELRIADADGKSLPPGSAGEILVRGGVVMSDYWQNPGETRAAQLHGWHRTGDLAVQDVEGFVTLVGRRKEMYISGGENVYPAEVERVLMQHPNVADAAVVAVPDPEWGETGRAYIVPEHEPFDRDELDQWLRTRLAGYKRPRQLELAAELPRTPSGKVQKHLLRR